MTSNLKIIFSAVKKLKRQIGESFFNPILYFLPLMVFVISNNFLGLMEAWKVSFPIALGLLIYIYKRYYAVFPWYVLFTLGYILIGFFYSLVSETLPLPFSRYYDEILLIIILSLILVFQKKIRDSLFADVAQRFSMSNNLDEFFRLCAVMLAVIAVFTFLLIINTYQYDDVSFQKNIPINYAYTTVVGLLFLYEIIRVIFVRDFLLKENWIPIVSTQGKIIGSKPYLVKEDIKQDYLYPVVRLIIFNQGKVLLLKQENNNFPYCEKWDTVAKTHVLVGESLQQALQRKYTDIFGKVSGRNLFISTYTCKNNDNNEYIYLFVSCDPNVNFSGIKVENTKWWPTKQIVENFDSGIFSEEFKYEYLLLERGGFIFSTNCRCDCELKTIVKNKKNARQSFS